MKKVVYVKRGVPDSIEIINVETPNCGPEVLGLLLQLRVKGVHYFQR